MDLPQLRLQLPHGPWCGARLSRIAKATSPSVKQGGERSHKVPAFWANQRLRETRGNKDMRQRTFLAATLIVAGAFGAEAQTAVPLASYADADGWIDVQKLTCAQLAGTYQEDADLLTTWYSGWYNGLARKHMLNVKRGKQLEHEIITYCKANRDKKVIQAIDIVFKDMREKLGIKVE
jgi:hypothetical protein